MVLIIGNNMKYIFYFLYVISERGMFTLNGLGLWERGKYWCTLKIFTSYHYNRFHCGKLNHTPPGTTVLPYRVYGETGLLVHGATMFLDPWLVHGQR